MHSSYFPNVNWLPIISSSKIKNSFYPCSIRTQKWYRHICMSNKFFFCHWYLTLRSVSSLNNPKIVKWNFVKIWSWHIENYHNLSFGYILNSFSTHIITKIWKSFIKIWLEEGLRYFGSHPRLPSHERPFIISSSPFLVVTLQTDVKFSSTPNKIM